MATDLGYLLVWSTILAGLWLAAFPLLWCYTKRLPDGGFGVGFPFATAVSAWIVWMISSLGLMPFSLLSSVFSLVIILFVSSIVVLRHRQELRLWIGRRKSTVGLELLLFFIALFMWSFVRGYQPDIQGLEKFMDIGFVNSILRSQWMPSRDPWLALFPINYYYFGHFTAAFLTLLSGIDSAITYNLMLATIFASTMVGGFSVVFNFTWGGRPGLLSGFLAATLLNFGGNLHTIWHFLSHQTKPYWYPDATRFIPFTIHEFPAYSHVVADLHGHLMDLPFVLLFLVILIEFTQSKKRKLTKSWLFFPIFIGFLLGLMSMTNTWDVPIYGLIFVIVFVSAKWEGRSEGWVTFLKDISFFLVITGATFLFTSFPFHLHFKNFAKGIALVEARSPVWQLGILWGGFFVIALASIFTISPRLLPLTMIGVSFLLIVIPEVIYVKDIYIKEYHRANTMFKLTYQSFMMFCLVFGMTLGKIFAQLKSKKRKVIYMVGLVLLLSVFSAHMLYSLFAVKGYYGLTQYHGLYGLNWMSKTYPDDYAILEWLKYKAQRQPVILEAVGESYTDYARFSTFSGLPTVLGWRVHEWLWRGSFDEPEKRTQDVMEMYQAPLTAKARGLFETYQIRLVIVGALERKSYKVAEKELLSLGKVLFRSGDSYIVELQ